MTELDKEQWEHHWNGYIIAAQNGDREGKYWHRRGMMEARTPSKPKSKMRDL